jgi:16S rRNA U1498 N3-methylase RsmE
MLRCFYSQLKGVKCATLSGGESHHLPSVLPVSKGMEVELIDGHGTVARGYVENPDKNAAQITVAAPRPETRKFHLSLIQATLTNNQKHWSVDHMPRTNGRIGVQNMRQTRNEVSTLE